MTGKELFMTPSGWTKLILFVVFLVLLVIVIKRRASK
jgi:hypothetical protein